MPASRHDPILVSPQTNTHPQNPPAAPQNRPHNRYSKSHARDVASSDKTDDTDNTDHKNDDEDVKDLNCNISRDDTPDSLAEISAEDYSGSQDDANNQKPRSSEARPHTSRSAPSMDKVEAIVKSLVTRSVKQCVALLQAWRAASTSSTLHLPPYKNHIVLYHNTQQAKYHEALARYQTRLAHIQLSRRFKKPGPNSAAIYQSRSDIQSLTYKDLARQLISLTSEEAEDDRSSAVKQLAAFSQLFARVIQGEQADPLFRLNVKSITHLASIAEAPQPPRPPISGPERIATHA
ncbi:hypothetical protein CGMCC3_g3049 [Colletotrichum fructicola]|uniref:Uncharacterized protein n=1 Tax=Colletotrichum fructicola (strain Nara gc5) TaxID=1213859 RepID=A0A7J6JN82_COLFN|nr:uncharacterized protein CGMCC3_g3049 [Colletotrichum fructicola]KAE9580826.1 hypothetical protein CGMCC3_g3049 [Colletotrichum fructicola]KAF4491888.1 hypothetical protein CGGC5_v001051 [Colletotrichum fructicola Nara gc5]